MTKEIAIEIFNEVLLFGKARCTQAEFKELTEMSIQALEQKPRWIPVSERLPKDRREVLVTAYWHGTYQVMMASYYGDGLWWCVPFNNCGEHVQRLNPKAWMPLPKAYREGRGMTRERIEDMREVVLPFVKKRLLEINYENLGESDAEMFAKDFDEILDLAIKALEQIDVLNKIKEEIKDNTYFINETTEKEGIDFETVEKIIDKYKGESENKE